MRIFFLCILSAALWAAQTYPSVYAALGDRVYRSAEGYAALLEAVPGGPEPIGRFVELAEMLKAEGFALERHDAAKARREYVRALRELTRSEQAVRTHALSVLDALYQNRNYAALAALEANPLDFIAESAHVEEALEIQRSLGGGVETRELETQRDALKARLFAIEDRTTSEARCLNDVAALNHWMIEANRLRDAYEFCDASEALLKLQEYYVHALSSCPEESELFAALETHSLYYREQLSGRMSSLCETANARVEFLEGYAAAEGNLDQ